MCSLHSSLMSDNLLYYRCVHIGVVYLITSYGRGIIVLMRMSKGVLKVELQPLSAALTSFDQAQNPELLVFPNC